MGGSASYPSYNPQTNPYSAQINSEVPSLANQESGMANSVNNQYAGIRNSTNAQLQAAGMSGTEKGNALGNVASQQANAIQSGNAQIQQQDYNNRLSLLNSINGPMYQQAQLGAQNQMFNQQQQNQQIQGGVQAGMGAAQLMTMLAMM